MRRFGPWLGVVTLTFACVPAEEEVLPDPGGGTNAAPVDEQPPPCAFFERVRLGEPTPTPSCPDGACALVRDLRITCPDDPYFGDQTLRVAGGEAGVHLSTASFNGNYLFRADGQGSGSVAEQVPVPQLPLVDPHLIPDGLGRVLLAGVDVGGTLDDRQLLWLLRPSVGGVYFGEPLTSQQAWLDLLGLEVDAEGRVHAWFTEAGSRYHLLEAPSDDPEAEAAWIESLRPSQSQGPHSLTRDDLELDLRVLGGSLRAHLGVDDSEGVVLLDGLSQAPTSWALARKAGPAYQAGGQDDSLEPVALVGLDEGLSLVGPGVSVAIPETPALPPICFTPEYDADADSCGDPCVDDRVGVETDAAAVARDRQGRLWVAWIRQQRLRTTSWVKHCATDPKDPDPPPEPPCFCIVEDIEDAGAATVHLGRVELGAASFGELVEVLSFDWAPAPFKVADPEASSPRAVDVQVYGERLSLGVIASGEARLIELEI